MACGLRAAAAWASREPRLAQDDGLDHALEEALDAQHERASCALAILHGLAVMALGIARVGQPAPRSTRCLHTFVLHGARPLRLVAEGWSGALPDIVPHVEVSFK